MELAKQLLLLLTDGDKKGAEIGELERHTDMTNAPVTAHPTEALQTLLRKRLVARILMWTFVAIAVLPILVGVVYFAYQDYQGNHIIAKMGFGLALAFDLYLGVFILFGFTLSLEWKQGLDERIQREQNTNTIS